MVKKKGADGFPHEVLDILVFGKEFPDLDENMQSPFRQLTKQLSVVAGDSLFAVIQSKGDPEQILPGQLRVAIDNLDMIPQVIKTGLMGNMQSAIQQIVDSAPKEPDTK